MGKITYLFGAGASYHAIPILNEMPSRMEHILGNEVFREANFKADGTLHGSIERKIKKIYDEISWLQIEASKHQTVDTFAKKLFIRNESHILRRLKTALSMYFMIEQSIDDNSNGFIPKFGKKRLDYRYDSFFASILGNSIEKLPESINILSWNYDYQFEMAFSEYSQSNGIFKNQKSLNVISKIDNSDLGKFNIIKLNGTIGNRGDKNIIPTNDLSLNFNAVVELLANWFDSNTSIHTYEPDLSFAWEEDINSENSIVKRAIKASEDTEILVVIGYSFPFFNREIDRKIINSMPKLKKVYFQDPNPDKIETRFKNTIRQRLGDYWGSSEDLEFIQYNELNEFLLPPEL